MTPVYHEKKDITVEVVVDWLGGWAQKVTRFIAPMVTAAVVGTILWQAPEALSSQVGPFEGAVFPWGGEVERFYLSLPLFASCVLIMLESGLDILKAIAGVPEPQKSHLLDAEG
ncbi:hypothetical protein GCM10007924_03800 [Sneathiella chinensis]|uniref:TRAP transporter small permease protein n=2 Tax=Sneathiella chinensis TaxID=349750 RepID=A0ABQ5TZX0_9PROT|nr:hypothetical protein GCM10007924_03800 [Sneathiella chinensis]